MRDINTLREDLARYARELDKRAMAGIFALTVTALQEARQQLLRLTPQWRMMPTVEEVRVRDLKAWLCKGNRRTRIHVLTVYEGAVRAVDSSDRIVDIEGGDQCEWWPCDDDGIREPSWPVVVANDGR